MPASLRRNRPLLITLGLVAAALAWLFLRYEPKVATSVLLSGLTLGALYFMLSSGLSLIFGLMDVLNFAHGLIFMSGAYFGYTLYANPRMLLNTLPLALAIGAGVALGALVRGLGWGKWLDAAKNKQLVTIGGLLGAALIILTGVWGFDILVLAANSATAAGGAVPTETAQEAVEVFSLRLLILTLGGLVLGLFTAQGEVRTRTYGRNALLGVGVLALAVAITFVRTPGEQFILGLDSNLRFGLALLAGAASGALLGGLMEYGLIRPLYARPIYQVLVTLGLVNVGTEVIKAVWGQSGYFMDTPAFFNTKGPNCPSPDLFAWLRDNCASIDVLGRPFPSYRIFIIFVGVVMFIFILLLLRRTRLGMIIRAGVQDGEMVQALGINVRWVFTLVFALGAGLSALGGVVAAPFIGVNLGIGQEFLLQAFISIVVGGMGSFPGAAMGALLVGLARAVGDQLVLSGIQIPGLAEAIKLSPSIARASTVLIMALVLLLRPAGLFGKKE